MNNTSIASSAIVASSASSDLDFPVTVFSAAHNPHGERWTIRELAKQLRAPLDCAKDDAPLWSPATFRDDHRNADNVEHVYALGFDVDAAPVPSLDALRAACAFAGFFHATARATKDAPRWRLVVFLSRPVSANEYRRAWLALEKRLPFAVGQEAKDPARAWYLPTACGDVFHFEALDGKPIDVDALLAEHVPAPASSGVMLASSAWLAPDEDKRTTAASVLGHTWPAKGRHRAQRALAGALLRDTWPEDDALEFLCDVCRIAGDEDRTKRGATIRDTAKALAEGRNVEGWATVKELVGPSADTARDLLKPFRITRADLSRSTSEEQPQDASGETEEANPLGVVFGGLDTADAPIEYLVDGIIPKASVCMFVAEPYTLKTFAALDVAVSVAHGTPWLGKHATKKGRVVYVNFEMHGSELKRRLRLLGDDGGLVGRVTHPDLSLEHEEFWAALADLSPDLVVVDTLSAGNPNVEEKDPRAAEPLRRAAKMANDTNCTFLFVHHTTKDASASKKSRVRGTGAIFGALDACYFFESVGTAGASAVECIKMRSGPEPAKFVIKLSDSTGLTLDGSTVGRPAGRPSTPVELWDSIRRYIQTHGPDVPEAIARSLKVSDKPVRDEMKIRAKRGDLVLIKRRYHLDGEEQRKARVLAALDAHDKFSTASQVARVANVDTSFVQELERSTVIGKTSYPDGWYVALKTRSTVGSTVEKQPNRPTVEPSNRESVEND